MFYLCLSLSLYTSPLGPVGCALKFSVVPNLSLVLWVGRDLLSLFLPLWNL